MSTVAAAALAAPPGCPPALSPDAGRDLMGAVARLERWSIFASFSCAVSAAGAGQPVGIPDRQRRRQRLRQRQSPREAQLCNVFAHAPGTDHPGVSSAVAPLHRHAPGAHLPPGQPHRERVPVMPLSMHFKPVGDPHPGTAFAGAAENYGMEKQGVVQANGYTLHKADSAYQPGGITNPPDKPFCKQAEWIVHSAGSMTFTGANQGLPAGF